MTDRSTTRMLYVLASLVLGISVLYVGKPLFMPLAIAGLLSVVLMPLCRWLERKGVVPMLAAILCGLAFLLLLTVVVFFIVWRVKHLSADLSSIKQHFHDYSQQFKQFLHVQFGLDTAQKGASDPLPLPMESGGVGKMATSALGMVTTLVVNLILIVVYLIMLLSMRHQIRVFILKLVAPASKSKTEAILVQSSLVVQQYLGGLAIVIGCLWVMYSIAFSVIGIENAIFFAVLCGMLEIVPFVGNITGSSLTCLMALSQGGGLKMVLLVLIAYAVIQSIQFYIISPIIMRKQVSVHPIFTILILIAGDLLWGITGMMLAIPVLGIFKIICDNVQSLHVVGYLLGNHPRRSQKA